MIQRASLTPTIVRAARLFAHGFFSIVVGLSLSVAGNAQTTIATAPTADATGMSYQRKTFVDSQSSLHWAFYYDFNGGSSLIRYASSPNSITWTEQGVLPITPGLSGSDFAVTYKTFAGVSYVFVATSDSTGSINVYSGTIAGSAIAFGPVSNPFVGSGPIGFSSPALGISTDNTLWIAALEQVGSTNDFERTQAVVTSANAIVFPLSYNTITRIGKKAHTVHGLALVPQIGPAMAMFINGDAGNIEAYRYNGATWSVANTGGDLSWFGFGGTTLQGAVKAIAVDPSDPTRIYAGGTFRGAGGNPNGNLVALWNGTSWQSLGTGLNGTEVTALQFIGTKLYVGGNFSAAGGNVGADHLASWDGTQWAALGSGVNAGVLALKVYSGQLAVGGAFTAAGGISGADHIALWNPAGAGSWSRIGTATFNDNVRAIETTSTELFVGGAFTNLGGGGTDPQYIARWDGTQWNSLSTFNSLNGPVNAIVADNNGPNTVTVGGEFTTVSASPSPYLASWIGTWLPIWTGGNALNNPVRALAFDTTNNILYVGGEFTDAGSIVAADHIASWDVANTFWAALAGQGTEDDVLALNFSASSQKLYVGGSFSALKTGSTIADRGAGPIAIFDLGFGGWAGGFGQPGAINGAIKALAVFNSELYVGGNFLNAGSALGADFLARWNGSDWNKVGSLSALFNDEVNALAVHNGALYIGGKFTVSAGVAADYLVIWNGTTYSPLGPPQLNAPVTALASSGPSLFVAGLFTDAGSIIGADYIAARNGTAWSAVGSPSTFTSGTAINALALVGSNLYAGGTFSGVGNNIAMFDGSSWSQLGVGTNGPVLALASTGTDVYVGGSFTTAGGSPAGNHIARWTGTAWNYLGTGVNQPVTALYADTSLLYVAGDFSDAGGIAGADNLATWSGTAWGALSESLNGPATSLIGSGGVIYAGGDFSLAGAGSAKSLAFLARTAARSDSDTSEISAVPGVAGDLHLLFNRPGISVNYRRFDEATTSWQTLVTVNTASAVIDNPTLSFEPTSNKLLAAWINNGDVRYSQGVSPFAQANWDLTPTAVTTGASNRGLLAPQILTGYKADLIWTNGSSAPFSVRTAEIGTSSSIFGTITLNSSPLPAVSVDGGVLGIEITQSDGTYRFSRAPDGVTYTITPTRVGYTFNPTSSTAIVPGDKQRDFAATQDGATFSGTVTVGGTPRSGVIVTITDLSLPSPIGSTSTDSNGNYSIPAIALGTPYEITATLTGFTFVATTPPVGIAVTDTTVNFTGSLNNFLLRGRVTESGRPVPGILMSATINGAPRSVVTDGGGRYSFVVPFGGTYTLTPSLLGHTLSPTSVSGTVLVDTVENFTDSLDTHIVSGTITRDGAPLAGITINGGVLGTRQTDSSGFYSFTGVPFGTPFTIRPVATGNTFSPVSQSGTATADRVLNFTAQRDTFRINGLVTVKGKPLSGVVIDGGTLGKKTSDSKGQFVFSGIAAGTVYSLEPKLSGFNFTPNQIGGTLTANASVLFKVRSTAVFGGEVEKVSQSSFGDAADQSSGDLANSAISINSDGQFLAFSSDATTLVETDENSAPDVFLKDRSSGATTLVSISSNGDQGDAASGTPSLGTRAVAVSGDGAFVSFQSLATNLTQYDFNSLSDVFIYNVKAGTQSLVSLSTVGAAGDGASFSPSVNDDGRYVAFTSEATDLISSDTNSVADIFLRDTTQASTQRISVATVGTEANGASQFPSISRDGKKVVFVSSATNLVSGDTNGLADIFLRDLNSATTTRISVSSAGAEANGASSIPAISADGSVIAFASDATNLVSGDTNGFKDIFVYVIATGELKRVSISSGGVQPNATSGIGEIGLSSDGRYVIFASDATNLAPTDTNGARDVFVHDRSTDRTGLVSRNESGTQGNGASGGGVMTGGGTRIAITSAAQNLSADDTNTLLDIFVLPIGPLPNVFKANAKIELPPTIVTSGKKVSVVMNSFLVSSTKAKAIDGFLYADVPEEFDESRSAVTSAASNSINYVVSLTNLKNTKDRSRLNTKRNVLTIKSVPAGSYKVTYRVELKKGAKVISKSKESPSQKITVK